jgi:hypothetical protein
MSRTAAAIPRAYHTLLVITLTPSEPYVFPVVKLRAA